MKQTTTRKSENRPAVETPSPATTPTTPDLLTEALLQEIDEVLEVPTPTVEFTLSDIIRVGAKLSPQAFRRFKGESGETCALQAAYRGLQELGL